MTSFPGAPSIGAGVFSGGFSAPGNPLSSLGNQLQGIGQQTSSIGKQIGNAAKALGIKILQKVVEGIGKALVELLKKGLQKLFPNLPTTPTATGPAGGKGAMPVCCPTTTTGGTASGGGSSTGGAGGSLTSGIDIKAGIKAVFTSAISDFGKIFANFNGSFKDLFKDFRSFFKGFGQRILGGIGGVFKQAAGNLVENLVSTGLKAIGIPGFAGGGRVQAGVPALVGERGPELIVPQRTGTVMNAASSRKALGAGAAPVTMNQTVNFDLQPAPTISAMIDAKKPEIIRAATIGAIQAIQRGGI